MARHLPERSSLHLVHGHAVAGHVDPGRIYAALFGELARHALERGVVDHVVHVPIGDPATEAAWVALGFGRVNAVAVRDLAPLERPPASDVEVRVATPEELDIVDRLVDEEAVFHVGSPMFRPYRRDETADAVRAELATELASDDHAFLIARREGQDVGVISVGPAVGSPLYVPDGAAYIAATAVMPDRAGIGRRRSARRGGVRLGQRPRAPRRVPAFLDGERDLDVVLDGRRLHPRHGPPTTAARRAHPHQSPSRLTDAIESGRSFTR